MGFPGKFSAPFQALHFACYLFPPISFVFIESWDAAHRDCFSGVELVADMLSALIAMLLHLFGPDSEEKIASVFLSSVGFGLTAMSLIGHIVYTNQRTLTSTDRSGKKAKERILFLVLFIGFVGFVTFVMLYMKVTAEDLPSAIYLGITIMIVAEVAKTIWPVWVRYGQWEYDQMRKDKPVVHRMKQAQSLLICFLSGVEGFSPISDVLRTSISVKLLRIASVLVMVLAGAQFACRWFYKPVVDDEVHED